MPERPDPHPEAIDVPEADAQEQARSWTDEETEEPKRLPLDVPEADALDQARNAGLDDETHDH